MRLDALPGTPAQLKAIRLVLTTLTIAVAAWLGYAFGHGQSLTTIARLYRDETLSEFTLDTGQLVAHYARTGGDLKPLLDAPDGTSLIDYSDWDYSSIVIVDGVRYEMVRLVPSASVDYGHNRIVEGLRSDDWELSREITLQGSEAEVKFSFMADRPVQDVRLSMAHVNWYFLEVHPSATGFTATVPHASRREVETGEIRKASYEVTVAATPASSPIPNFVHIGVTTPYGVESVSTDYHLVRPPVGQYVPVAVEKVTFRKLAQ